MPSDERFCVLREFGDQWSAVSVQSLLAGAEIRSHLTGTDPGTALSMGGAPTDSLVRIQVAAKDFDRADELLRQHEQELLAKEPWLCARCDEPNEATFEYCWNCQASRSDIPVPKSSSSVSSAFASAKVPNEPYSIPLTNHSRKRLSLNPYEAAEVVESIPNRDFTIDHEATTEAYEAALRRALLASICTIVLLTPISCLLPLYLLANLPPCPNGVPRRKLKLAFIWFSTLLGFLSGSFVSIWMLGAL
ncbi:hypothetical protein [Rhodopirellula sp. MGV]|uniref:DUF7577 domain-containing protein n=1 Tax=Rhodopirellula sp. MGV TaxID=2023130 RepID=UPI000B96B3CF|nr:hypothetical protein [Rhodopirellula sp. MGV]OYP39148.1 hypothetical protein CGZ80_00425 [Rhodopirellula sp. MGV]PNY35475.1 hypothetical protein C2E31_18415 [Rhodopirellula baltica]